jgi:hypothetical protein
MTVEVEAEVFRILSWSRPMGLRRVMENSTLLTDIYGLRFENGTS